MSRLKKSAAAGALAVAVVGGAEGYRAKAYRDSIGVRASSSKNGMIR